jgi:hypothetical protein
MAFTESEILRLLEAGQLLDKGALTVCGRACQKHGDRRGTVFPRAKGNPQRINLLGLQVLEGILRSKNQRVQQNRFGGKDIWDDNTKRGVRYVAGDMIGFLEPSRSR